MKIETSVVSNYETSKSKSSQESDIKFADELKNTENEQKNAKEEQAVQTKTEEVGSPYSGKTLFYMDQNGEIKANYEESMAILEKLFPKDKYIFLMCGGGGYAGMTKNLLVSLGRWLK